MQPTNMETLSEEVDLTSRTSVWDYRPGLGFVARFPKPFLESAEYRVPIERLARLHHQLPAVWRARIEHFHVAREHDVMAMQPSRGDLVETLNYLNRGGIEFMSTAGPRAVFTSLVRLDTVVDSPGETAVTGYMAHLLETTIDGAKVTFPGDSKLVVKPLPTAYLSQLYPGWESRYQVGFAMGLDNEELISYTFSKDVKVDTRLPNIDLTHD